MRPRLLYPYFSNIESLQGVGPKLSGILSQLLGGTALFDLLGHLPSGLVVRENNPPFAALNEGDYATFRVVVQSQNNPGRNSRAPFRVTCVTSHGFKITAVFFSNNAGYNAKQLPVGEERIISGRLEQFAGNWQIAHPDYILKSSEENKVPMFEPHYPLKFGLTHKKMHNLVQQALEKIPELPEWQNSKVLPFKDALSKAHNPLSPEDFAPISPHRTRLAYDELLAGQLAVRLSQRRLTERRGRVVNPGMFSEKLIQNLPFALTVDQLSVLKEIEVDLASGNRMLRLLQGDVGSGKTVVGLITALHAIEAGMQVAYMAPTSILARQQYEWINSVCHDLGINVALLTSAEKGKKREAILAGLKAGEIHIIIGTHALFQEDVEFANLGLAIIDEQHRFGVIQRLMLSGKGENAHVLLMTATPIPRSLQLALYGDINVSSIRHKPAERLPIDTRLISSAKHDEIVQSLTRLLDSGGKAYWICPLVEESEVLTLTAAEDRFHEFTALFGAGKVGILHGRMSELEKASVMQSFASGAVRLLVATTVVEVGIDVRDATVIFIEHAERFGLAQLHQLRGRVGRGDKASTCMLIYAPPLGNISRQRLETMRETNDGFEIAEADLRLRGGGEVLGTKQSGEQSFRFADLAFHGHLLNEASIEAENFLKADPHFKTERGEKLKTLLSLFRFDESLDYIESG